MSQLRDILSENLKSLRKGKGWNQDRLAEESGLSLDSIRNIESKRAWVSSDSAAALAGALGVTADRLFTAASAANPAAPTRDSLIVGILTRLPALKDDQVRALFNIVDGFAVDNAETKVPEQLARKKN